jgi:GNAT superfamily N-acetyltransferase
VNFRKARLHDAPLLAQLNHQLIQDEGHSNPATLIELTDRMRQWLAATYTGIIFEDEQGLAAYALYQEEPGQIYLRQFFVARDRRRRGVGRQAFAILRTRVWPPGRRLTVSALWDNHAAIAFWKAMGYREYSLTFEIVPGPGAAG